MHINQIDIIQNNLTFENKKFRVPIKLVDYDRIGTSLINFRNLSGKWVREYSNPNAKEIYKQAQKEKNLNKKIQLIRSMGHYALKDISFKTRITEWFNKIIVKSFLEK